MTYGRGIKVVGPSKRTSHAQTYFTRATHECSEVTLVVELAQAWPNYSCEKLRDFITSKLPTVSYQPSNLLGLYLLLDVVYVWTLLYTAQLTAGEL